MKAFKHFYPALMLLLLTASLPAQQKNHEPDSSVCINLLPDNGRLFLLAATDTSAKTKQLLEQLRATEISAFRYMITKCGVTSPADIAKKKADAPTPVSVASDGGNSNLLSKLLIGMLLGMIGQSMRIIVGLKKKNDSAEQYDAQRLFISLLIGLVVGAVAGVLVIVDDPSKELKEKAALLAIIAAGYAGSDFIEGFIQKNNPVPAAPPVNPAPAPPAK